MPVAALRRNSVCLLLTAFLAIPCLPLAAQETKSPENRVLNQAVLHLSFDEADGIALDTAGAGSAKDNGQLLNGAARVKSPFAGQKGKSSVIVDASRKQFIQIADSPDLDLINGVTISCFYLHLGSAEEVGFQGLFAKRTEGNGATNYGINFGAKQDLLQVYLHDGAGYKLAHFGVQQALGIRRPGFLTATYEVGDAPGADADQDKDDILVRLFLNGQALAPKQYAGNINVGNDTWILNVNAAAMANNVPLTIGSSTPTIEFATGVYDEFSVFSKALSPDEVLKLFQETAGPYASTAVLAETLPAQAPPPAISALSLNGLQVGATTSLIITGTNLQPTPIVSLSLEGAKAVVGPNSNANQLEVQVTVPASAPIRHYPIRVQTSGGISNALPLAVDGLVQLPAGTSSPEKPVMLPAAISGVLSGSQQARAYFRGLAKQHVVADVECRRLGSTMTPVVEIKTATGTPLKIEWGHVEFRGDARAEALLPHDGLYYVELHDLSYAAPGANAYRLKIGDLKTADGVLGGVSLGASSQLTLTGIGLDPNLKVEAQGGNLPVHPQVLPLPASTGIVAPAPALPVSAGPVFIEAMQSGGQLQTIDARLESSLQPIEFYGSLGKRGERDVILLQVTPGQKLNLQVSGAAVDSPLDPQLQVLKHPEGTPLAGAENAGTREAALDFVVPAGHQQIQLAVRDLRARGGANYRYGIRVAPAGTTSFTLSLLTDRIQIPQDGDAVVQIEVNRAGGYNGQVKLSVTGDSQLSLFPNEIPGGISKAWLTLARTRGGNAAPSSGVRIVGETVGVNPPLQRTATVPSDPRLTLLADDRTLLATSLSVAIGSSVELGPLPAAIYRGVDLNLPVQLKIAEQAKTKTARLTLLTTEAPRLNNPNDANQGKKPIVDGGIGQTVEANDPQSQFKISVPTDIAEPSIDFVLKAELVEHPFAQNVYATTYSKPFRLPVQNAVAVQLAANSLMLNSATAAKFTGTIKRTAGFTGPVIVLIVNLPAGSNAPPVTIPAGQEAFEVAVTPPTVAAAMDVANVVFRVQSESGKLLQPDVPLPTKIAPAN